jgi:hypothetical protein
VHEPRRAPGPILDAASCAHARRKFYTNEFIQVAKVPTAAVRGGQVLRRWSELKEWLESYTATLRVSK